MLLLAEQGTYGLLAFAIQRASSKHLLASLSKGTNKGARIEKARSSYLRICY